jgi:hypothetical protein
VQGAIYRPDGDVCQFRYEVDTTPLFIFAAGHKSPSLGDFKCAMTSRNALHLTADAPLIVRTNQEFS